MSDLLIRRDFVRVGDRQVHCRHAGQGHPIILLHQSPRSSAELVPLIRHLAQSFHVIAPDTPGYGHSDPLSPPDSEPTIDQFADALAGFLDVLDLRSPSVFGTHTGAIIATRFASRYPERVCSLVANGVMLTTPDERKDLLDNYFPRFSPTWDGSHLAWLWSRLRDQLVFYPWYKRGAGNRIEWAMSLEELDAWATDLLDAGDNYRGAYRAVIDYDIAHDLPRLIPKTCLLVAQTDALSSFVPHYPPQSNSLSIKVVPDFCGIPDAVLDYFTRNAGNPESPRFPACAVAYGVISEMLLVDSSHVHIRKNLIPKGRPIVFLHDLGSSVGELEAVLGSLAGYRPVLAMDLPGHGLSDIHEGTTPAAMAAFISTILDQYGLGTVDIVAEGATAALALSLQDSRPGLVEHLVLCNPIALPGNKLDQACSLLPPELASDSSGAHLLRAWGYLKDKDLYMPWHQRHADCATPGKRPQGLFSLQSRLIDLLRSRDSLAAQFEAAISIAPWERIQSSRAKVATTPGGIATRFLAKTHDLPHERVNWGKSILELTS